MYAKAIRKGQFDLVGNGTPVEIVVGQVIQVPDSLKLKPGSWLVKCDKQGNVIDAEVAKQDAKKAREKADKEAEQARAAAVKAEKERKEAEAAEKRAKELEEAAAKEAAAKGEQPKDPPKA